VAAYPDLALPHDIGLGGLLSRTGRHGITSPWPFLKVKAEDKLVFGTMEVLRLHAQLICLFPISSESK